MKKCLPLFIFFAVTWKMTFVIIHGASKQNQYFMASQKTLEGMDIDPSILIANKNAGINFFNRKDAEAWIKIHKKDPNYFDFKIEEIGD